MNHNFKIETLGSCAIPSPISSVCFVENGMKIRYDAAVIDGKESEVSDLLEMAGPHREIFFDLKEVRAAIVTCGGLCPGLNDVIRGLVMVLWYMYGVREIYGIRYGYQGLTFASEDKPLMLSPEIVEDINSQGGTILGSSRGNQSAEEMVDYMVENQLNMLFTIGGDGTQRGALGIAEEIKKRNLKISVIGIPKTIDNDIAYTERTFGFETAIEMSRTPVICAHKEAKGAKNGIGLVKLMGRDSGFIAANATLATSDVNLLLIPEVDFSVEKVMNYLEWRMLNKSHAVIVAAEGAGQRHVAAAGVDASGNKKHGDIGLFLKDEINKYFSGKKIPVSVKYFDPSYTIRSSAANANDSVFCFQLAENAVHAAMSGRTAMVVSIWNNHFVNIPSEKSVEYRKKIDTKSLFWQSVLNNTGQPDVRQ